MYLHMLLAARKLRQSQEFAILIAAKGYQTVQMTANLFAPWATKQLTALFAKICAKAVDLYSRKKYMPTHALSWAAIISRNLDKAQESSKTTCC